MTIAAWFPNLGPNSLLSGTECLVGGVSGAVDRSTTPTLKVQHPSRSNSHSHRSWGRSGKPSRGNRSSATTTSNSSRTVSDSRNVHKESFGAPILALPAASTNPPPSDYPVTTGIHKAWINQKFLREFLFPHDLSKRETTGAGQPKSHREPTVTMTDLPKFPLENLFPPVVPAPRAQRASQCTSTGSCPLRRALPQIPNTSVVVCNDRIAKAPHAFCPSWRTAGKPATHTTSFCHNAHHTWTNMRSI